MFDRVLLPTAPDSPSQSVASYGLEIAAAFGADALVVSVLDRPQERDQIRADQEREAEEVTEPIMEMAREAGVSAEREIRSGEAEEQILGLIADRGIDLVVMGTHARTGVDRVILGSVAESVIRESPVPVLTVTPDAAASVDVEAPPEH